MVHSAQGQSSVQRVPPGAADLALPTPEAMAASIKAEVIRDIRAGVVPATVQDFARLHDFVDANCYGGTEQLFDVHVTASATGQEHQAKLDQLSAVMNPAQAIVDAWLRSGAMLDELAAALERSWLTPADVKATTAEVKSASAGA